MLITIDCEDDHFGILIAEIRFPADGLKVAGWSFQASFWHYALTSRHVILTFRQVVRTWLVKCALPRIKSNSPPK